ncbi:unnamed protein product, partial [Brenthis ino]
MWLKWYYFVVSLILLSSVTCESTETSDTATLLKTYRSYIIASHDLDKSDRSILKNWTTDFQIQLVNITTHYRLEMTRHKEHNFITIKTNSKWSDCIDFHHIEIYNSEKLYFNGESKCLQTANAEASRKKHSVYQLEKEIRKWRKSYRYLSSQCNMNNPGDEEAAGECLVEYMQKDNYYMTFQRLILLKMESMSDLYAQILKSLSNCEECLKSNLSVCLSNARNIMDTLNHCYRRKDL